MFWRFVLALLLVFLAASDRCLALNNSTNGSLESRVITFCRQHLGKQVGNGICEDLVDAALKFAGAKVQRGAYYGRQVYSGTPGGQQPNFVGNLKQVKPGCVVHFNGPYKIGHYFSNSSEGHVAIIESPDQDGTWHVYQQNYNNKKYVTEGELKPIKLTKGSFQVFAPVAAGRKR